MNISYNSTEIIRRARERQREAIQKERARMAKIEEEQRRITLEQKKQAAEQARQAEEIARHEDHLLRHDKEITKLNFKINQAEEDIAYLQDKVKRLIKLAEFEEMERDVSIYGGGEFQKHERKLIALENQIRTASRQLEKAVNVQEESKRKVREAM